MNREPSQTPPSPSPAPGPMWQQPAGPTKRSAVRATIAAPLVLAVLLVVASVFAGTQVLRPDPQPPIATPLWGPYVEYAKQFAIYTTTISYRDPDRSIERILDGSTGRFHDIFAEGSSTYKQRVAKAKVSTQGSIDGAGLESIRGTTALVLVAATSIATDAAGVTQEPRRFRMLIHVEKVGDTYKTSEMESV